MTTKEKLEENIKNLQKQVAETILNLDDIKTAIINKGVVIEDNTPVQEYKNKIQDIQSEITDEEKEQIVNEALTNILNAEDLSL